VDLGGVTVTALVVVAVALGAVAQSTSGIGFALVCGPLIITARGQSEGVRLVVLLQAIVNVVILVREKHEIRYADAALLLAPAVVATIVLVPVIKRIDSSVATVLAGSLTVIAAIALLLGGRVRALHGPVGATLAGIVSAAMNAIGGIGGPAVALYAANAEWPAASTRSTLQAYFLVLNLVTLAGVGLPSLPAVLVGWLAVALGVGYALGAVLTRRLSELAARRATLLLAAGGGLTAVVRALW
jgi:uncharacterized membrane protein YfcA